MRPENIVFLVLMIAMLYMLLIRPQQRRLKQHQALVASVEVGDEILTIGGIYGRVARMDADDIWLEVSDGVEIRLNRRAVSHKINPETESPDDVSDAIAEEPNEETGSER